MHWTEIWYGNGLGPKLVRTALTPASWLYAAGWSSYLATYQLGLKKPQKPHTPIVCIGNLVVGGSGKSPLTLYVADVLKSLGRDVVIGCSGYGSPASEGATLAPMGELKASEWGDEPAMMRWLRPELPIIVGRKRVRAAEICHQHFPAAVLLMDDGFQHLPLAKDVTILLDPPTSNPRCLPAGPYREPRRNRSRATLVVPGRFKVVAEPLSLSDGNRVERANLLCALGSPRRFVEAVRGAGVELNKVILLPDHDNLQRGNLFEGLPAAEPLIVTAKDWVKLRERTDLNGRQILIANHAVRIDQSDDFRNWLSQVVIPNHP